MIRSTPGVVCRSRKAEADHTVLVFQAGTEARLSRIPLGVRPNGLAYDPRRNHLLAANVGNPQLTGSFTVSIVDVERREMVHSLPVPGRTRWTVYDRDTDAFYVNIAGPAQIVVIAAAEPARIQRVFDIPVAGPRSISLPGVDLKH